MENTNTQFKTHVFVQGDVLYQLIMSAPPATLANLSERDFFNSFQPLR